MKFKNCIFFIVLFTLTILFFQQCRKKDNFLFESSAKLELQTDSILFDTVFTTIGSTTKRFKIYNRHKQPLIISNIRIKDGFNSNFRINVDGYKGPNIDEVEILAEDSLFVFVEVTVDPNNATTPMVVVDEIIFTTNGNEQKVVLEAWGQDAYFHVNEAICGNVTWPTDKPHVLYGIVAVGFPDLCENSTLNIPAGTIVHGHVNSTLLVYKSSLNVNGTTSLPVTFRGDRLEDYLLEPADSVSGQWRGLYFIQALESTIESTTIRNAVIGIQADTLESGNTINLSKVKIENSSYAGILTQGANVKAENCLFGNAGTYSGVFSIGGNIEINHCTFGNYISGVIRQDPAFLFADYYEDQFENPIYRPFTTATFTNCIMYGNIETEFVLDTLSRITSGAPPIVNITNCLVKQKDPKTDINFLNNITYNVDANSIFEDPTNSWDFHLKSGSPAIGKASLSFPTLLNDDIEGNSRGSSPDLGCYEK